MSTYRVNLSRNDLLRLLGEECLRRHGFGVDYQEFENCRVEFFAHSVGMRVEVTLQEDLPTSPELPDPPKKH